jgi:hypothetical protein
VKPASPKLHAPLETLAPRDPATFSFILCTLALSTPAVKVVGSFLTLYLQSRTCSRYHRMGTYDVFISHCGADCKRDFAVWLLRVLENVGLRCFFDDRSLKPSEHAASEMLKAMDTAAYGIIILSAGFFGREWCMKELQTFAGRERILPVFFGTFDEVQRARDAAITGCKWQTFELFEWTENEYRQAAEVSTQHTGLVLEKLDGCWDTLIFKVRDEVLGLLGKENGGLHISEDKLLVSQDEHLEKLKQLLGVQGPGKTSDGAISAVVGIVGVKGMGGVGKTTTAKKLSDDPHVRECFKDGVCWLEVGLEPSDDKIRDLQRQILQRFCHTNEDIGNPTYGRALIKQRLSMKKVLIFLDNVWGDASTAVAVVNIDDLGPGSRIVKTSREEGAIGATGTVHEMDVLDPGLAWKLFCWHAFGGEDPDESIADGAKQAVDICHRLPLALELMGKQVRSAKDKQRCLEAISKLPQHADAMTACLKIIELSFDRLPGLRDPLKLREVFVTIAGVWLDTPEFRVHQRALENIGAAVFGEEPASCRELTAQAALDKLRDASLIGARGESISVHDLIVDVAKRMRHVVEHHIVVSAGRQSVDLHNVASLVLEPDGRLLDPGSAISSPCKLLSIQRQQMVDLRRFRSLQCLRWHGPEEPLAYIPSLKETLMIKLWRWRVLKRVTDLTGLRILELHRCHLPKEIGQLTGLTTLHLSWCKGRSLPTEIGGLTGLTKLGLEACMALRSLPEQIGQLTGLTRLNLSELLTLQSLPEQIGGLTGLTTLDLSGCWTLESLPTEIGQLTGLTTLDLSWCKNLRSLPTGIGGLTGLTTLDLSGCRRLQSLPTEIGQLTGLTSLNLRYCEALQSLPKEFGQLTGLTWLGLACMALQSLEQVGQLTGLKTLDLLGCGSLLPSRSGSWT